MKIIHIASFVGNIGDALNHQGFYELISEFKRVDVVKKVEIRDFYFSAPNRKKFDVSLANEINTYDLCIIGGGGFFDLQWDNSVTGTSIDFSEEFINTVNIPVLINAIGYHEFPEKTTFVLYEKFENFLQKIVSRENWTLTVRNDGSYERLTNRFDKKLTKNIIPVLDNAFYLFEENFNYNKDKIIGLCITNDLFSKLYNKDLNEEMFNDLISEFIVDMTAIGWKFIFFAHTPQDIDTIVKLMKKMPSKVNREYIRVAPYFPDVEGIDYYNEWYRKCNIVIGMRFHSCIFGLINNRKTIALAGHEQIEALYKELGLSDYCVRVDNQEFVETLKTIVDNFNEAIYAEHMRMIKTRINDSKEKYRKILMEK